MVAVVGAQSLDPIALALGFCANLARLFECGPGGVRICPRRRRDEYVVEQVDRDSPICDRAIGVLSQDSLKRAASDQKPVGMDHRDAALELGLYLRIAGGRETQLAKSLVLLSERTAGCGNRHHACQYHRARRFHVGLPKAVPSDAAITTRRQA